MIFIAMMNHPILAIFPPSNSEVFVIAILVLVMFGAKKLPLFASALGKSIGEFTHARREFERELQASASANQETPPNRLS